MPEQDFPTFELLPAGEEDFTPDEELAELVADDEIADAPGEDPVLPIGRTIAFDYDVGSAGGRPIWVDGDLAVVQVAQVALRTRRGEHPIFDDDFGMTDPDAMIGKATTPELRASYQQDVTETLLSCHERITAVGDFLFLAGLDTELAYVDLTMEIDGNDEIRLQGIPL